LLGARKSKLEQDDETHISALEYHDILEEFNFDFHLKIFSGILPQAKEHFEIMQTKCSKKALFVLTKIINTTV
jgi:hypothetical protein